MRTLAQVEHEIAALRAERRELLRQPKRSRNESILQQFDGGMDSAVIARRMGIHPSTVRHILWQSGRTKSGRRNARTRLREHFAQGAPA